MQQQLNGLGPEEVRQHHMQAHPITYEYVNKDSSCAVYCSVFWITASFSHASASDYL